MRDLTEIRKEIDETDRKILELFQDRLKLSEQVAEYKIAAGKQVYDRQREEEKLRALREAAADPFSASMAGELFRHIMAVSRIRQYQMIPRQGASEQPEACQWTEALRTEGGQRGISGGGGSLQLRGHEKLLRRFYPQRPCGDLEGSHGTDGFREGGLRGAAH